jgi:glucan biosynthesis protein C
MHDSNERLHGLDALRAVALLLGVLLHSIMPYVLPPGLWAVGTTQLTLFLGWLAYYLHSFRLEVFFLLAGFFAATVIGKRGTRAYIGDRAKRIVLVFAVAIYPMKFLLGAIWIMGGRKTGWLKLPPEMASRSWMEIGLAGLKFESWSSFNLTHLWFLYYLACITGLFLAVRWLILRCVGRFETFGRGSNRWFRRVVGSPFAPLLLAMAITPILARMRGADVDTPDRGLTWNLPVMALYGFFFAMGWWLHRQVDLLNLIAKRSKSFLILGLFVSLVAAAGAGARLDGGAWATENAAVLRWATSFGTGVTMALSVFGWLGLFVNAFKQPSARIRYVADASYWIYIAHLPLVVALQVWWANSGMPWWVQVPLVNVVALVILFLSYHWCVRFTWVGAWLNGRRGAPLRTNQAPTPACSSNARPA